MVLFEAKTRRGRYHQPSGGKAPQEGLTERTERVEKTGRKMPLTIAGFSRTTPRTLKFIRWLRRFFWQKRPLDERQLILKQRYAAR